jgi:tRNA A58 N-methylase Trm61
MNSVTEALMSVMLIIIGPGGRVTSFEKDEKRMRTARWEEG